MRKQALLYKLALVTVAVVPGILFLPSLNPISSQAWNALNENAYTALLRFQKPDETNPSNVVVVEVDDETLSELGWPLDRSYYIQFLDRLKELGHPWVLSTLWWESLASQNNSPIPLERRQELDTQLTAAIGNYERFVGSSIKVDQDEEPSTFQEETLLPRVLKMHPPSQYLPFLPMKFMEADQFVEKQAAFGMHPRMGSGTIHCATLIVSGPIDDGGLMAIPTSTMWAAALSTGRTIQFGENFQWNPGGPQGSMQVGGRHCLTSPAVTTDAYFKARGIPQPISFSDVLKPDFKQSLAGKVVVLAKTEGATYVDGPGIISQRSSLSDSLQSGNKSDEDAIKPAQKETRQVYEHVLNARFLDGLISGNTIIRSNYHVAMDSWGPIAVSVIALLIALLLPLEIITMIAFGGTVFLLTLGAQYLYRGQFEIPMHTAMASTLTGLGWLTLYGIVRANGIRAYLRFTGTVRRRLSECNSLESIELETRRCLKQRFRDANCTFAYDKEYYNASRDNRALARLTSKMETLDAITVTTQQTTALAEIMNINRWIRFRLRHKTIATNIDVNAEDTELGRVGIKVKYDDHERYLVGATINFLCEELSVHWNRVRMLVEQRVKEYKLVEEKTRGDIMSRFLSQAVLSKFSGDRSVEENLDGVLTAKAGRAALLQADIRGYSQFSAHMKPLDTVNLLRLYYQNVVDVAQQVAQVKLIGDCIFLFIERGFGTKGMSPADLMLQISSILVRDTLEQNRRRDGEALNFGIAIHYGDVVVGNLSSEQCIDYTVIGPNVNQVARMEELTKHKPIQDRVGLNGIVLSEQARQAMVTYKNLDFHKLSLPEVDIQIRSFSQVKDIYFLTAEQALQIVDDTIFGGLSQQEKFAG